MPARRATTTGTTAAAVETAAAKSGATLRSGRMELRRLWMELLRLRMELLRLRVELLRLRAELVRRCFPASHIRFSAGKSSPRLGYSAKCGASWRETPTAHN